MTDHDAAKTEGEGIPFQLAGREWTTVPLISAGAVFDLADATNEPDLGAQLRGYRTFLNDVIDPDSDGFDDALRSVPIGDALNAAKSIVNTATARPFTPPSPSPTSE